MRRSSYAQTKKHITHVEGTVQHVLYVGICRHMLVTHMHSQGTIGGYLGVKGWGSGLDDVLLGLLHQGSCLQGVAAVGAQAIITENPCRSAAYSSKYISNLM